MMLLILSLMSDSVLNREDSVAFVIGLRSHKKQSCNVLVSTLENVALNVSLVTNVLTEETYIGDNVAASMSLFGKHNVCSYNECTICSKITRSVDTVLNGVMLHPT